MSLTISSLKALVNVELENNTRYGSAEFTADGTSSVFLLAPMGRSIISDDAFEVYIDNVITTAYTMDFSSGECSMTDVPAAGSVLNWDFNYIAWSDAQVESAVVAAIDSLFPSFYIEKIDDTIVAGDFVDNELEMEDCEAVIGFMSNSGSAWARTPRKAFEMYKAGGSAFLRFFGGAPSATQMRLHYVARATVDELPDRAAAPIVSYACYYLLLQKTAVRTRGDVAIVTQGTGILSPRQMNDAANAFYLRYNMQLASMKLRPWSVF
jgi:hypothetical protein